MKMTALVLGLLIAAATAQAKPMNYTPLPSNATKVGANCTTTCYGTGSYRTCNTHCY
jgi:hypothetical protein